MSEGTKLAKKGRLCVVKGKGLSQKAKLCVVSQW